MRRAKKGMVVDMFIILDVTLYLYECFIAGEEFYGDWRVSCLEVWESDISFRLTHKDTCSVNINGEDANISTDGDIFYSFV